MRNCKHSLVFTCSATIQTIFIVSFVNRTTREKEYMQFILYIIVIFKDQICINDFFSKLERNEDKYFSFFIGKQYYDRNADRKVTPKLEKEVKWTT